MLQTQAVEPRTLELLRELQKEPLMSSFNLVGGTALALRIGHRKSIDLDFFTKEEFDIVELREMLVKKYAMKVAFERGQTLKGFINGVMIDCIRFNYPHIAEPDIIDGVRLESVPDIIAMKLDAVSHNGTRIKDFVDIAVLSAQYSLDEMLQFYLAKYPNANVLMPVKSLVFFDDINFDESVVMINGLFDWKKIAQRLFDMTEQPKKIFK
ncbi:MAG: nucleotidyl transferase AbiEii/AbiGii toxin family protein [Bacteroidaceae bacterium]|nr:nucleotidyl transferase AbiEii/AbiGii toxin family protein [Bacteroidaceae bacterium]